MTTEAGKPLDIQKAVLISTEKLETLASSVVKELHSTAAANMANKKLVRVCRFPFLTISDMCVIILDLCFHCSFICLFHS